MTELRGGLIGCGFFARNQMNAWNEIEGVRIVSVCDTDAARAEAFAEDFDIAATFTNAATMLQDAGLDFVDIVTQPASHRPLVELAASHRVPVICQKPLAPSLEDAHAMVNACAQANIPFMVHENFRWQSPMRALKANLDTIGTPFFGRILFRSGYDPYKDQPYLAQDPRFILYDVGVHILDVARFFLGEVRQLTCLTQRVNPNIQGEDVATVLLAMESGATCIVELSYASRMTFDPFPQTLVYLEGDQGRAELGPRYRITLDNGETVKGFGPQPRQFAWSHAPFEAIQESVVAIQEHWVECLQTGREPETSGADNLKTLELVFGAYESAAQKAPYRVQPQG